MNQENQSPGVPAENPSDPAGTFKKEEAASVNFHSVEFNRIDELNDWSGNYRSFQPLEGVVTADMRHQMERRRRKDSDDSFLGESGLLKKEPEIELDEAVEKTTPLFLISKGRILIVDIKAERAVALGKTLSEQQLTCILVVTKKPGIDTSFPRLKGSEYLEVEGLSISGTFGGFLAKATAGGDQKILNEVIEDQGGVFDLILDLQPKPSYEGDCLPIGYYSPGENPAALDEAMAELPEMRGQFRKPQFISFQKNQCFHGRSAHRDCRRCLEICPFGAIQSLDQKISISPYRCQGCGGCSLVCPTEAIHLNEPSSEDLLNRLRGKLKNRSTPFGFPITLVISDSEWSGFDENYNGRKVYFHVEQIARVGLEILLAALAYGAGEILVVYGNQNSTGIIKAVEWQIEMARAALGGLGLPEDKIRSVKSPSGSLNLEKMALGPLGVNGATKDSPGPPATFSPGSDKRRMVRLAGQHLYDQSGHNQPGLPLPIGSPFGTITIDKGACTLCLACAAACPSRALSAGGQVPQLKIREALCHQCGLCQETCPEGAIQLIPRLLCDLEAADTPVILQEVEPFRCIVCGQPFATPAMINRMQEKLLGHWMYSDERQLRRLRMCGTCRARDALMSEDMKLWNQK